MRKFSNSIWVPQVPRIWGPGIVRILILLLVSASVLPLCSAQVAATGAPSAAVSKRPMTFEDMMQMKRLGETAVSADGRWLAYSVTTVDLEKNTKTPELWLQRIESASSGNGLSNEKSAPFKIAVAQPGDSGPQFDPGGKRILFQSSREGGQQVWIADFDSETGATANARKLTRIATEADRAIWSPDGKSVLFTSAVYPDCPAITTAEFASGDKCNSDRDVAQAANPVKAQIFTHLLYRHWDHYTGDKRSHLFLVSVDGGGMRDLNPSDTHDVPPFSLDDSSCGCDFAPDAKELAFTENPDPEPAISTSAADLHARSDEPGGETGEDFDFRRRQLQPGLLARWEVPRMALAGAGGVRERQVPADGVRPGCENSPKT